MLSLCGLGALALFLPGSWQKHMGIAVWTAHHRVLEWMVFSFCGVFSFLSLGEFVYRDNRTKKRLKTLPADEQEVLRPFVKDNVRTRHLLTGGAGNASGLIRDGILLPSPINQHSEGRLGDYYYTARHDVFKYLKRHPRLVGLPPKP
jgi:hypothetical protein